VPDGVGTREAGGVVVCQPNVVSGPLHGISTLLRNPALLDALEAASASAWECQCCRMRRGP
jgi:hypothetical protein